jgi:hypothetical protein
VKQSHGFNIKRAKEITRMSLLRDNNRVRPAVRQLKVIGWISCLTVFAALSSAETYIIPHFPVGGGWSTRLVFSNIGPADVTADVTFYSQTGTIGAVTLEGRGTQSSEHLIISRNAVITLNADPTLRNAGPLDVTWAKVTTNGPLTVFVIFDSSTPTLVPTTIPATLITGSVGAQAVAAAMFFRFPLAAAGPLHFNLGIAIANPNSTATDFTVFLLNANGTINDSFQMTLQANSQTSFVVSDSLIFGNTIDITSELLFNGSIAICASQPVAVVPIGIEGGALYTIPVANDAFANAACPVL